MILVECQVMINSKIKNDVVHKLARAQPRERQNPWISGIAVAIVGRAASTLDANPVTIVALERKTAHLLAGESEGAPTLGGDEWGASSC